MQKKRETDPERIWSEFKENQKLTQKQFELFQKHQALLSEWNKNINLTAIRDLAGIVRQHFKDSLALKDFINLKKIKVLADIGTGAGFPAIPLKIIYPHLKILLIEVNKKKQNFLDNLIKVLDLKNVEIVDIDWRTFLRTTQENVDLFVTRATINELELCRMFKPACFYKDSKLVYWISNDWKPHPKTENFLQKLKTYKLGKVQRKLAFFGLKK